MGDEGAICVVRRAGYRKKEKRKVESVVRFRCFSTREVFIIQVERGY